MRQSDGVLSTRVRRISSMRSHVADCPRRAHVRVATQPPRAGSVLNTRASAGRPVAQAPEYKPSLAQKGIGLVGRADGPTVGLSGGRAVGHLSAARRSAAGRSAAGRSGGRAIRRSVGTSSVVPSGGKAVGRTRGRSVGRRSLSVCRRSGRADARSTGLLIGRSVGWLVDQSDCLSSGRPAANTYMDTRALRPMEALNICVSAGLHHRVNHTPPDTRPWP